MYPVPVLRRGGQYRRHRFLALLATPALGVSLIAAAPSPAATVSVAEDSSSSLAAESAQLPMDAEPVTITLITGDRVSVTRTDDGEWQVVQVEPVPRPDGTEPVIEAFGTTREGTYVLPDDVRPFIGEDLLDVELFNVGYLAENGYADEDRDEFPVIVEYADSMSTASVQRDAQQLPASEQTVTLKTVNAAAVTVKKDHAAKFWAALAKSKPAGQMTASQTADLPGGVEKVWLDQVAYVSLDESVPQVGAPQAWDAGFTGEGVTVAVLDTGIDAVHPDLTGKVVAAENLVDDREPVDDHGHGTHVASTISGSGAASDGARRGVAPDAELVSGKVCGADGRCPFSAIMAGMEWAARDQAADVVNMSLGTEAASNGLDLQSQLLNELTEATGTLFVTSAGNSGPGSPTVGSPAAADAALAVGAVDKADQLAAFSSRGPRAGDRAIKPEITAPGVGIVAARAGGTGIGVPIDEQYTSLNGTSMASPHVAGAAAILKQQHPHWGPDELKAALVSSATSTGRLGGAITSGPHDGTTYTMSSASNTRRIDTAISGTPTFVGHACDAVDAGQGIALVERGPSSEPCTFQEKLDAITAAGYEAGIVFNQPGTGCLDEFVMQADGDMPFVFVDRQVGLQLLQQPDVTDGNACDTDSPDPGTAVASTTIEPGAAGEYTVYQQGAGRLDVARAVSNQVQVSPATADFRFAPFDRQEPLDPQTLTYTNPTSQSVTLNLSLDFDLVGGESVPEGVLTLSQESVTVPAGGIATVSVTLDHTALGSGEYSGRIIATDENSGIKLTTPVGYVRGHEGHRVTVTVETGEGQALRGPTSCPPVCDSWLFPVDVPFAQEANYNPTSVSCVEGDENGFGCVKFELVFEVPAGTYNLTVLEFAWASGTGTDPGGFREPIFLRPGVVVDSETETEVAFHTDDLVNTTPETHRPSQFVAGSYWLREQQTEAAGGLTLRHSNHIDKNHWITPTEPVTLGELNVGEDWYLVNRPVEMTVSQPERFNLTTAVYPDFRPIELADFTSRSGVGAVRFSGSQTLPVVDVGAGSAADFAGRDVAGSLALMHVAAPELPISAEECVVQAEQLQNAFDAGAVGVLMSKPHGMGYCSIRPGAWSNTRYNDIDIPWVSLSVAEADRLRGLLEQDGSVTVRVTDTSDDEYAFFLSAIHRNGITDALPYTVTEQDVAEVVSHYNRDRPGLAAVGFSTVWPDVPGPGLGGGIWNEAQLLAPTVRTEYIWANAFRALHRRAVGQGWFPGSEPSFHTRDTVREGEREPMHWNSVPVVPGAATESFTKPLLETGISQGFQYNWCAGCRAGDLLAPTWYQTSTDPRQVRDIWRFGPFLNDSNDTVELYRDGQKIPLTEAEVVPGAWGGVRPVFELSPERAAYELRLKSPDAGITTTWEFTSETVTSDEPPEGLPCEFAGPCRAEPLVYLRYDAGGDLDNTVSARGAHRMKVTAYHQNPDGSEVAGLRLWTSVDGGEHWRASKVRTLGDGHFEVIAVYPPAHRRASDQVSIKSEAWDFDGNRVEQTLLNAFTLQDRVTNRGPNQLN